MTSYAVENMEGLPVFFLVGETFEKINFSICYSRDPAEEEKLIKNE